MSSSNTASAGVPTLVASNSPILRQRAVEVPPGEQVGHIIAAMWRILEDGTGIGLAANQIGHLRRIIIIDLSGMKLTLVNPVITNFYKAKISSNEGCLSFPGKRVMKIRYKKITVEGYDIDLHPIRRTLSNLAACVVQHEIDHLDGKVIAD